MMMTKYCKSMAMLIAAVMIVLLSSCSSKPKYESMIPDDSAVLIRLDVKQMAEQCNFEKSDVKDKMLKAVDGEGKSAEAKKVLKKVIEDPAELGVDLRVPVLACVSSKGDGSTTVFAEMHDADKLTQFINAAGTQGSVKTHEGLSFLYDNGVLLAYNDNVLCITTQNDSEERAVKAAHKLLGGEEASTISQSDDVDRLLSSDGIATFLIRGELYEMPELKSELAKTPMPKGLNLKDMSVLCDIQSKKGSVVCTVDLLTKSDAWKAYIDQSDKLLQPITDDLLQYASKKGMAMMANIDGKAWVSNVKDNPSFKALVGEEAGMAERVAMAEKLMSTVNGNMVVCINKLDMANNDIQAGCYVKTTDSSIADMAQPLLGTVAKVGYKDNTSYIAMTQATDPLQAVAEPFSKGDVKGKFYFYLDFSLFKGLASMARTGVQAMALKGVTDTFSNMEIVYLGGGKTEMTLNLCQADKYPLESLMEAVSANLN